MKGDKGYITVKGLSSGNGMSRYEWEKEIPVEDAMDLLRLCEKGMIDKTRHIVEVTDSNITSIFEIDEFHGDNEGLVIAEIELASEEEEFLRPQWLGEEVTADPRYYNSYLSAHPYTLW
jgi:adenylate cyclase